MLLVDGEVAGVWHHRRSGRRLQLAVEPLGRLPGSVRSAVEKQAERVAVALEATALDFRIGEITVGPHAQGAGFRGRYGHDARLPVGGAKLRWARGSSKGIP